MAEIGFESLPALLKQFRDQGSPSRLMIRANPGAIIAVKILIEQNVVLEIRIGLKFLRAPEHRAIPLLVT